MRSKTLSGINAFNDLKKPSGGVAGAKLISRLRRIGQPAYSGVVPTGAKWVRIGCTGHGGSGSTQGGGGAYSYDEGSVTAGQTVSISDSATFLTKTTASAGSISVAAAYAQGDNPGLASNCTGSLSRTGGSQSGPSQFGGDNTANGGGSAGDTDFADGISLHSDGMRSQSFNWVGPGAGCRQVSGQNPGPGACCIEFWSSNPRL